MAGETVPLAGSPLGRTSRYYGTELELFRVHRGPRERDDLTAPR